MTAETKHARRPLRYWRSFVFGIILAVLAYGATETIRFVYQAY
jgi:hypothetical protein